jgi:hypothetical protein
MRRDHDIIMFVDHCNYCLDDILCFEDMIVRRSDCAGAFGVGALAHKLRYINCIGINSEY